MLNILRGYPFITLPHALIMLRIVTAGLFMAHAMVRIANNTIPQFGGFMERLGFPAGEAWVWAISAWEIIGGLAMIFGFYVRVAASGLFAIAGVGIILIHRHLGWFVGEHGTGGSEYSVALMVMLLVVMANDRAKSTPPA